MKPNHATNMNRFYDSKWEGHSGYWLDIFPKSAQVYAISLGKARNNAIDAAVPARATSILDIGCGVGDLVRTLSKKGQMLVGLDIAEVNVKLARQNLRRDGLVNTAVVQGCAENLAFVRGAFDVVIMADVIEHVRNVDAALNEIARVLHPGGLFICVTPHPAVQTALLTLDSIARFPIRIARRLSGRTPQRGKGEVAYERFLSKRTLRAALKRHGMTPLKYKKICFYPGPEGGGLFSRLMGILYRRLGERRFHLFAQAIVRLFGRIERLQLFNQKQLWIVQR